MNESELFETLGIEPFDVSGLSIGEIDTETEEGNPDEYEEDVTTYTAQILQNGKVVGFMDYDDYFGYVHGKLFNKDLPELSDWRVDVYPSEDLEGYLLATIERFFQTKTGQRWAANLSKYQQKETA